jgi:hypothetical protein
VTLSPPPVVPSFQVDLGGAAQGSGAADQPRPLTVTAIGETEPAPPPQDEPEAPSADQAAAPPAAEPEQAPSPGLEAEPQHALSAPRVPPTATTVMPFAPMSTPGTLLQPWHRHGSVAARPKSVSRRGVPAGSAFTPPRAPAIAVGRNIGRAGPTLSNVGHAAWFEGDDPPQGRRAVHHPVRRDAARPALPRLPDQGTGLGAGAAGSGGGSSGSGVMALIAGFVFLSPGLTRWLRVGRGRLPRLLRAGRRERPG